MPSIDSADEFSNLEIEQAEVQQTTTVSHNLSQSTDLIMNNNSTKTIELNHYAKR